MDRFNESPDDVMSNKLVLPVVENLLFRFGKFEFNTLKKINTLECFNGRHFWKYAITALV